MRLPAAALTRVHRPRQCNGSLQRLGIFVGEELAKCRLPDPRALRLAVLYECEAPVEDKPRGSTMRGESRPDGVIRI
jgi:hypothetical protein